LYRGDIFALVSLDAFDEDFRCSTLLLRFGFCGGGFGGFLLCVFLGAFLGVDGEGGEVLFDCFCIVILVLVNESGRNVASVGTLRVQLLMHTWMMLLKPFFAFLYCSTKLAVLCRTE
jgi:hypothetical protein